MLPTSIFITFIIPLILMVLPTILSKKLINDRGKSSPFECGFDHKSSHECLSPYDFSWSQ